MWIGDLDQDRRQSGSSPASSKHLPKRLELKLEQKEIKIGRINSKCPPDYTIESSINSRMISRNHATIERLCKGGFMLYDHSMNGTYVNYTRVTGGVVLKDGDIVCFGHLNGANLKPGETVSSFFSDLKYKVELTIPTPSKETGIGNASKQSHYASSEDDFEDDVSAEIAPKRSKLATGSHKKITVSSKPTLRHTDVHVDDNGVNNARKNKISRRSNGDRSASKKNLSSSSLPKPIKKEQPSATAKVASHGHSKEKRPSSKSLGRSAKASPDDLADDKSLEGDIYHYDLEECSAKPCKHPQDAAIDWIQCDKCTQWYHQVCVGVKASEANVDTYFCPYCKK